MLPYLPSPHPLHNHPLAAGMTLPSLRGTLAVAADLNVLHLHPFLSVRANTSGAPDITPSCWIGDFLLFLIDRTANEPFCVNISVKGTRSEFRRPQVGVTPKTDIKKAEEREAARHQVEEILFKEAGIPTHFVAAEELDPIMVANLLQILLWQKRRAPFGESQKADMVGAFNGGMGVGKSALEVMHELSSSSGCTPYDAKIVLYQAIWQHKIKIDLFEYFFIDRPMIHEKRDVIDIYGHWFQRGKP